MGTATGTENALSRSSALVLMAVALVFAPLAWGTVTPGAERILFALIGLAALARLAAFRYAAPGGMPASAEADGHRFRLVSLLWLAIVLFAWASALNAASRYDETVWVFVETAHHWAFLPATSDAAASLPVALQITVMAIAFVVLLGLAKARNARWHLFAVLALTGAFIAAAGLCLKASGSRSLLFTDRQYLSGWPFAVFRYHGHAAACLNLAWPAALALLVRSLRSRPHAGSRPLWIITLVLILTGVFANSSKGGHAVAVLGLLFGAGLFWRPLSTSFPGRARTILAGMIFVGFGMAAVALVVGGGVSVERWLTLGGEQGAVTGRLEAYRYAAAMATDAGLFGFGPGTFGITFPDYTGGSLDRFWEHAHQDYLQTLIEWGWLGSALWLAIFAGAAVLGIRELRSRGAESSSALSTRGALLALAMIALHCLFDFPLQIASLQLITCFWLACLWSGYGGLKKPASNGRRRAGARKFSTLTPAGNRPTDCDHISGARSPS